MTRDIASLETRLAEAERTIEELQESVTTLLTRSGPMLRELHLLRSVLAILLPALLARDPWVVPLLERMRNRVDTEVLFDWLPDTSQARGLLLPTSERMDAILEQARRLARLEHRDLL